MLVATQANAIESWENIKEKYNKASSIGSHLNEIMERTCQYTADDPIEFSKESFLKNIDFGRIDPEDVFEYIDFEAGYIDDELTLMGNDYFKDQSASFGWKFDNNDQGILDPKLVYEISVGGPNIHLIFYYNLITSESDDQDIPEPEYDRSEFQYHWWSPTYTIDTTEDYVAQECLRQIEEEALDMFESNYPQT